MDKPRFNYQVNPQFWRTYIATMTAFIVNPRVGETLPLPQRIFKMSWLVFCMYTKRPPYKVSSGKSNHLGTHPFQDPLTFVGYQTYDLSGAIPIDPYTTFFGG